MNSKRRKTILLSCIIFSYVIVLVVFFLSILGLSNHTNDAQIKYIEDSEIALDKAFQESQNETDLQKNLDVLVNDYPMEIVVVKNKKTFYSTTADSENALRDKANKSVFLAHTQGVFSVNHENFNVTYNLYHMQDPEYLVGLTRYQLIVLLIAILILLLFLSVTQYILYKPLEQIKRNLTKIEDYDLGDILIENADDEVNEKLREVVVDLNQNIDKVSRDFTQLEQALQIEKERLENVQTVSRAFVHDLKTPLHQTLLENEIVLEHGENITPELEQTLLYNIEQTDRVLKIINEILDLMDENIYDTNNKKEVVDFSELLSEARKMFTTTLKNKELYLAYDVPEHLLLETNATTLRLLIHNVLSNAMQYANIDSEIELELIETETSIKFICTNEATNDNIERMKYGEKLFKKNPEYRFSSGKGLFLIKELTAVLNGTYELLVGEQTVSVTIVFEK